MKKIFILSYNSKSIGVKVIIDALMNYLGNLYTVECVNNIDILNKENIVVPYGPKETFDALKRGYYVPLSLMVDYHTLSLKNRTKFLIKNGYLFKRSTMKSLLGYFLYYYRESFIAKHCDHFMFVSQTDINLFNKRFSNVKCYCVPNGVNIPDKYQKKKKERKNISLGILSGWTEGTFLEAKWFIDSYWPKIIKEIINVELIICGKFASEEMKEYFNSRENVSFIGEVESLSVFFDQVDVYVATKPIGCGILNKVLDAFAYKTLTIGIDESFTGFTYMENSYLRCNTPKDYIEFLKKFKSNREQFNGIINNAFKSIQIYNNWRFNYQDFVKRLQDDNVINR